MYQAYWGLGRSPFRGTFDPRFFHQGSTQDEALARLHFLIEERRALGLLLGEAGTGKSMLLEMLSRQLHQSDRQTALINLSGLDEREFLWLLTGHLGSEARSSDSLFSLHRALADHITANRYQQISTVLLLDDIDLARAEVLDQIVRLTQYDTSQSARVTIVLSAQTHALDRLGSRLLELVDLRIDLDGWDQQEMTAFIKQSLAGAGRTAPIFSEPALRRLHQVSAGIPRRVKQVADLALLAGAGRNLVQIEADTIEAVYQELSIGPAGAQYAARN